MKTLSEIFDGCKIIFFKETPEFFVAETKELQIRFTNLQSRLIEEGEIMQQEEGIKEAIELYKKYNGKMHLMTSEETAEFKKKGTIPELKLKMDKIKEKIVTIRTEEICKMVGEDNINNFVESQSELIKEKGLDKEIFKEKVIESIEAVLTERLAGKK